MKNSSQLSRFNEEVLRQGPVACLPSNLSPEWLEVLSQEAEEATSGVDEPQVAELLAAVLLLLHHINGRSFSVSPVELDRYINYYAVELSIEEINRNTDMQVERATIETIFTDRKFNVVQTN